MFPSFIWDVSILKAASFMKFMKLILFLIINMDKDMIPTAKKRCILYYNLNGLKLLFEFYESYLQIYINLNIRGKLTTQH